MSFKQPCALNVVDRDFFFLLHLTILTGHCVLTDTPTGFVMQLEQNNFFQWTEFIQRQWLRFLQTQK